MSSDAASESRLYFLEDGSKDGFIVSGSIVPEIYNQEAASQSGYTEKLVGAVALKDLLQANSDN